MRAGSRWLLTPKASPRDAAEFGESREIAAAHFFFSCEWLTSRCRSLRRCSVNLRILTATALAGILKSIGAAALRASLTRVVPAGMKLDAAAVAKAVPNRVSTRLYSLLDDYWEHSGGISTDEATSIARANGFGFEIGRVSRFENARNAVVLGAKDLRSGQVNRILLAEEIQHGFDRAGSAAEVDPKRWALLGVG
jgi:hypothetical protein